jgi:spermidine/putrescine transport system substrate-binding protein
VAVLALALGLAACGGGGGGIEGGGGSSAESETVKLEGKPSGSLTISNWPYYIDKETVPHFEAESGVKVKYIEDVNDNESFFSKMQPLFAQGESGGRSIAVVTNWMADKMHKLGYLQNFDKSALPNFTKNLSKTIAHPAFDPKREYSAPWQSGLVGLIVRKDLAPNVRSICDLFEPQYKGKVEMLNELRQTVPEIMKCMGVDPGKATEADWSAAIEKLKGAAESGQIRRFTGNDYTSELANGNAAAVIGWSGDAVQLQADNPEIEFRMPTEGCIIFSDNMVIPVGAPNPTAAEAWINSTYDPKNEARIEDFVNYVSPVEGVKPILIFPSASYTKNCSIEPTLSGEEEQNITREFNAMLNG